MMDYFQISTLTGPKGGMVRIKNAMPDLPRNASNCIHNGISIQNKWPRAVGFQCHPTRGKMELPALISNTLNYLILSKTLANIFLKYSKSKTELLPIELFDSSKKFLSDGYFIVNPLGPVDCLDIESSEVEFDEEERDVVIGSGPFVLKKSKLTNLPHLFRPKESPANYIMDLEMLEHLDGSDISNLFLKELKVTP